MANDNSNSNSNSNTNDSDFFQQLIDEGVDEEIVSRFRTFNDASPLRHRARKAEKTAQQLADENAKYRDIVMHSTFKQAGLTINPKVLQLPDDLDITSHDAVSKWAIEMGLKSNSPSASSEEFAAINEINEIASGAEAPEAGVITPTMAAEWSMDKSLKFAAAHPEAWEQIKRGEEVRGVPVT